MAKGKSRKLIANPILYTIEDKLFGKLEVLNTENAWWGERAKVENLIAICKVDASVAECCSYAGITNDQYKYFYEKHPYFSTIKELCNELPNIKARNTVVAKIGESYANAMDYLKRKKKDEFGDEQKHDVEITLPVDIISTLKKIYGEQCSSD